MDRQALLDLYDRQLRIDLEPPGARRQAFPHLVRIVRPAPRMNYVSYSRLAPEEIEAVIRAQVAFFASMAQPFSWHVCSHDSPAHLTSHLLAGGFLPDADPDAVMVLDCAAGAVPPLSPAHEVGLVGPEHFDDIAWIEQEVNGGDHSWLIRELGAHREIPGTLSVYLARQDGLPAACGWVYFYPGTQFASLYGGATLPPARGRGLYSAVIAARLQDAVRRGCRFVVAGANATSRPILERVGFRLLTRAYTLEWGGSPEAGRTG